MNRMGRKTGLCGSCIWILAVLLLGTGLTVHGISYNV
jgi:hypothetical protein